jgi:two-component system LytT family response regulator
MNINCIIIDDEPIARKGIENYIKKINYLSLLGSYSNPEKLDSTALSNVDLIYLDIQLHKINGLDFYKQLKPNEPFAIVISAFANYALDGFELNVVDYLLKPVSFERFQQAVLKVKELLILKQNSQAYYDESSSWFFIKSDNKLQKLMYDEVIYMEGSSNYVILYTTSKKYLTYLSLNILEDKMPSSKFIRIHKSYIIAINKIDSLKNNDINIQGHSLPLSKSYKGELMKLIDEKLLKK